MKKILVLVLVATMFATGCSTAWLNTFDGYLQVAGPILVQILEIVAIEQGKPVNAALVAKINADQAAVTSLAKSISAATGTNPIGVCAEFNTSVTTFAGDLTAIEQLANIGPSTSVEIQAAVGIAQAAFTEIEVPLAACARASSVAAARSVFSGKVTVTSPEDVVKKFNATVDSKHRVYLHSRLVRFLTFGVKQ